MACDDAHLGLATTERLLEELEARVDTAHYGGLCSRERSEDLGAFVRGLRHLLTPGLLAYRTVDG